MAKRLVRQEGDGWSQPGALFNPTHEVGPVRRGVGWPGGSAQVLQRTRQNVLHYAIRKLARDRAEHDCRVGSQSPMDQWRFLEPDLLEWLWILPHQHSRSFEHFRSEERRVGKECRS